MGCPRTDCPSKAKFKTVARLQEHLRNKHGRPLVCTVQGCTRRKPFGRDSDLKRHMKTVHEATELHPCPFEDCRAHVLPYARKDKRDKHVKDNHPRLLCQQGKHCNATIADHPTEQQRHLEQCHGNLECGIGRCQSFPGSRFTYEGLKRHLAVHHQMSGSPRAALVSKMRRTFSVGGVVAITDHLPSRFRAGKDWQECSVCGPELVTETAHDGDAAHAHDG